MQRNKTIDPKKTVIFVLLISLTSGFFYFRYFYTPKKILKNTLVAFETSIRGQDYNNIKNIVSKKSILYDHFSSPAMLDSFNKFHPGIEIVSANYTAGSNNYTIHGVAKMKAKEDGKYRELGNIYIEKENSNWKIRQFGFPDYLKY